MPNTTEPKGWSGTVTIVVMDPDRDHAVEAIRTALREGGLTVNIVNKLELRPVYRVS